VVSEREAFLVQIFGLQTGLAQRHPDGVGHPRRGAQIDVTFRQVRDAAQQGRRRQAVMVGADQIEQAGAPPVRDLLELVPEDQVLVAAGAVEQGQVLPGTQRKGLEERALPPPSALTVSRNRSSVGGADSENG